MTKFDVLNYLLETRGGLLLICGQLKMINLDKSMAFVNNNLLSLVYSSSSSTSLVLQFVYFVIISLRKGIKIYFALLIYISFFSFPSFPVHLFDRELTGGGRCCVLFRAYRRHYRCRIEIQLAHDFPLVLRFAGGRDQSR